MRAKSIRDGVCGEDSGLMRVYLMRNFFGQGIYTAVGFVVTLYFILATGIC